MTDSTPTLEEQLARLDAFCEYLPSGLKALVRERYQMGYQRYGDAWVDRDNLAEVAPEIADAVVYLFQYMLTKPYKLIYPSLILWPLQTAWRYLQQARGLDE